ncbi:MAG TPA: citrate synthase [Candidatus Eisenbacteria bacterium]
METVESQQEIPYKPGLEKVPAAISSVCYLDGDIGVLEYRGYLIDDLAHHVSYEETAYLLLNGELPTKAQLEIFEKSLKDHRSLQPAVIDVFKSLPVGGHPMHALEVATAATGMYFANIPFHAQSDPHVQQYHYEAAVRLIAKLPTMVAAWHRVRQGLDPIAPRTDLDHSANFLYMLDGHESDPELVKVFDACMVLHAEHEMNASTFATRVTASALSDPYSVVVAAIATLRGPLHGGANERVLDMLAKIGAPENVETWVQSALASKETIWGIGHREYRVKDPRAVILQEMNEIVFKKLGRTPLYDTAVKLEEYLATHPKFGAAPTLREQKFPNVDFYSGIVYQKMGIPVDLYTPLFAMSRVAGWLAHYMEQVDAKKNKIFRPKQIYDGARERKVTPIAQRA